ncbi:MAG TPA: HIT family protein [Burkholderiales bacterium]|nr:HIT family protein [Burkholderiales bacterium]
MLWEDRRCRVVLVGDVEHPGYCRVVWNKHVREMTDLTKSQRAHYMTVVYAVERTLRSLIQPDKINLASIGNRVPHLHWHVVPRFEDDSHFPGSIWSEKRTGVVHPIDREMLVRALYEMLGGRRCM